LADKIPVRNGRLGEKKHHPGVLLMLHVFKMGDHTNRKHLIKGGGKGHRKESR